MLVVLVLLIGVHPVADEFVHEAAFICAVIALAGLVALPLVGGKPTPLRRSPERGRPPPRAACLVTTLSVAIEPSSVPLRR